MNHFKFLFKNFFSELHTFLLVLAIGGAAYFTSPFLSRVKHALPVSYIVEKCEMQYTEIRDEQAAALSDTTAYRCPNGRLYEVTFEDRISGDDRSLMPNRNIGL